MLERSSNINKTWKEYLGNTFNELERMTKGNSVRLKDARKASILINDIEDMSSEVPFELSVINLSNEVPNLIDNIASGIVSDPFFTQNQRYLIAGFILALFFVVSCVGCLWFGYSLGGESMHDLMTITPLH
jgi:hypothetical protein